MDPLKVAVIGVGIMGGAHIKNVNKSSAVELAAICDIKADLAEETGKEHGVPFFIDSDEIMAQQAIDAVIIATPHYSHTPISIAAMESGKHVLVEKPVGVHKADIEKMIAAHEKNPDIIFSAVFQQRTLGPHRKIKELIDNGELGEIRRVNWIVTSWFRTQRYFDSGSWRATWSGEGGGVLLNQCPHQLDLFQWFFGMPVKVRAFCGVGKYHKIETEDDVTAYCEYPNGATGVFISSTGEAPGTNRLEVVGDKAHLLYEDGEITIRRMKSSAQEFLETSDELFAMPELEDAVKVECEPNPDDSHFAMLENFAGAIANGEKLVAEAGEGIHSIELANSMIYSSMKDQVVELPLDSAAYEAMLMGLIESSTFDKGEEKAGVMKDFADSLTS